jgi:hypothetical protein
VKAVLDAEVGENMPADGEISPTIEEAAENTAPEVDEPAPKHNRTQGRQKGYNTPQAEIERQEQIKEAMEYRLMGLHLSANRRDLSAGPSGSGFRRPDIRSAPAALGAPSP